MKATEKVDVLAVMSPRESQITKNRDWRTVSTYRAPDIVAPAGPSDDQTMTAKAVNRTLYEEVFAQCCVDDEKPKQYALIEVDELAKARDAVARLIEAVDRVFYEWDNIGPALGKLRSAPSGIKSAT